MWEIPCSLWGPLLYINTNMYNYLKQWSSQPTYLQNKTWLAISCNKVPWCFCFGFYSIYIYIKQWSLNQSKFKDWKAQARPLVFCRHLVHLGSSLQQTRVQVEDITCQQSGYLQNMILLMLQKSKKQQLRYGENPQKPPLTPPNRFLPPTWVCLSAGRPTQQQRHLTWLSQGCWNKELCPGKNRRI